MAQYFNTVTFCCILWFKGFILNKKCIITSKYNKIIIESNIDIYYIEDYITCGNIREARILTNKIYHKNKEFIQSFSYKGYKVSWSWFDQIYQITLNYTEIKGLILKLKKLKYEVLILKKIPPLSQKVLKYYFYENKVIVEKNNSLINYTKQFIYNSIFMIFTLISIIYFFVKNKKYVGIRTEDMIYKNSKNDFRLINLYSKLRIEDINYIEFIRTQSFSSFISSKNIRDFNIRLLFITFQNLL